MSGRKNKNKHRGQQRGQDPQQSTELLDELNSIRDLLGSDELGDIPLLDQVAGPAPRTAPAPKAPAQVAPDRHRQPVPEPLDESELPILFSPVDEELPEDFKTELNETEKALLRPLQDLPTELSPPPQSPREQQQELFAEPDAVTENPFLPAHIRARLTGGRVPRDTELETAPEIAPEETPDQEAPAVAEAPPAVNPALATDSSAESGLPAPEAPEPPGSLEARGGPEMMEGEAHSPSERAAQRQQLIDRLVAKQLPELERQLRARIELMIDELEAKR